MPLQWPPSIGGILAIIVLVVVVVLAFMGQMEPLPATLIGMLAVARLI